MFHLVGTCNENTKTKESDYWKLIIVLVYCELGEKDYCVYYVYIAYLLTPKIESNILRDYKQAGMSK